MFMVAESRPSVTELPEVSSGGARAIAVRTSPDADVCEVAPFVRVIAAAAAPSRIERAACVGRERRVIEAEPVHRAGPPNRHLCHGRVVGIEDERAVPGSGLQRGPPQTGDCIDFAVPVELIAKEVCENDDSRLYRRHRGWHRRFVGFEQAGCRSSVVDGAGDARRGGQRAGHAAHEIAALAVMDVRNIRRIEGGGEDTAGCRLTVRARDHDPPTAQRAAEVRDHPRVQPFGHQARQRGAAPTPGHASSGAGQLAGGDGGRGSNAGH